MKTESTVVRSASRLLSYLLLGVLVAWTIAPTAIGQTKADGKAKWDSVVAEAKKEGTVVVFGPAGTTLRKIVTERFAKAFPGIKSNFPAPEAMISQLK
jgi:hypothetical protein